MLKKINPDLLLVVVAVIWGTGFIATEYAIGSGMTPSLILAIRFSVAFLVLAVFMAKDLTSITRSEWLRGGFAGVLLFLGFFFQTTGQSLTTISNSAFLTATNVVFVPFIVWALTRHRPKNRIFILALMTFLGIAVLTVSTGVGSSLNIGDLYVLLCSVMFAFHIAYLSIAVSKAEPIRITFIQMLVAAVLSIIVLGIDGRQAMEGVNFSAGLPSVVYLGVFSTCVCFFLQTTAQKRTQPSKAGIIMSTESLFGTLFSVVLGIEPLTAKIIVGGTIIMTAVMLTEVEVDFVGFFRRRKISTENK